MILLIDGYNLLRSIFHKERGKLDKQRDQFISLLGLYKRQQAEKIKQVIVVFDAGPDRHASREVHNGVVVMYSGQRRSADDWIVEYVENHRSDDIFLISDDLMLLRRCQNKSKRVTTMGTEAFYRLVQEKCSTLLSERALQDAQKTGLQKYRNDDSNSSLDMLMEEGSRHVPQKQSDVGLPEEFMDRTPSQKISKKERQRLLKTKKLV